MAQSPDKTRGRARGTAAPGPEWSAASAAYEEALRVLPEDAGLRIAFAHFLGARAEVERAAGTEGNASLKRGLSLAEEVLKARPKWGDALVLRGSLRCIEAQGLSPGADEQRALARRAAEDLRAGVSANGHLAARWNSWVKVAIALGGG
ncbi:MAG: hypothetical protein R3B70_18230 [Polyangiaceae bacterium]